MKCNDGVSDDGWIDGGGARIYQAGGAIGARVVNHD